MIFTSPYSILEGFRKVGNAGRKLLSPFEISTTWRPNRCGWRAHSRNHTPAPSAPLRPLYEGTTACQECTIGLSSNVLPSHYPASAMSSSLLAFFFLVPYQETWRSPRKTNSPSFPLHRTFILLKISSFSNAEIILCAQQSIIYPLVDIPFAY